MAAPQSAAEKEKTAQLVASLPLAEQVDLAAQALLREYMHRRGFTNTLRAFDEQNPRDERTISSRAVMRQLLNIPVEGRPSRLVPRPAGPGSKKTVAPTYMEELCSYRLSKREYALATKRKQQLEHKSSTGLSEAEAAQLAHWQRERQTWEDPSDTEMTAWCEETEQHRIQREAAESLLAEGPKLMEEEAEAAAARAEKKRRLKEARRKEKKKRNKLLKQQQQQQAGLRDDIDGVEADEAATAAAHASSSRWAPPGTTATALSTTPLGSRRSSLDRGEMERSPATAQDREDWTLSSMALNPILAAARNDVAAENNNDDDDGAPALGSKRSSFTTGTAGAGIGIGSGVGRHAAGPSAAAAPPSLGGTGTAFRAAPIGIGSRSEITEAWQPQSSSSSTTAPAAVLARGGSKTEANTSGASAGAGGGFTYNPSAVPVVSAMSKTSVFAHPTPSAHTGGGGGSGSSAAPRSSTGSILSSGSSGGLSAAVRGDGEHVPHSGGSGGPVRHGFGFRKDPGSSGGAAADGGGGSAAPATGGRKDRRVKLLID